MSFARFLPARRVTVAALVLASLLAGFAGPLPAAPHESVTVRTWSLPSKRGNSPAEIAGYRIRERFEELHPHIRLEATTSLQIEGHVQDAAPLMAIAGGTSPDILTVNFRQSDTYVSQGFLAPLDEYIAELSREVLDERIPESVRPVVHRRGPDGQMHYYMMPSQVGAKTLMYRRDLFAAAGLDPDRPPRNWEELREMAVKIADPSRGIYGVGFLTGTHGAWSMFNYLVSAGASAMIQIPNGEWRAAFDSDEAVTAYEFVDELQKMEVTKGGRIGPVAYRGADFTAKWIDGKVAMQFVTLGGAQLGGTDFNPQLIGVAPVPLGPTGKASSEVNCGMHAIFAGQKDKRVRDAAWAYIRFTDSPEARRIYTETMVEQGAARNLRPKWLITHGFPELADLANPGLEAAFERALRSGTPEPYGKNCQYVYTYMTKPMEELFYMDLKALSPGARRAKIKEVLARYVHEANERMIGILPEPVRKKRNSVAWIVAAIALASFGWLIRQVFRWINEGLPKSSDPVSGYKNRMAVMLIAPSLLLILMWQYYPLLRGSLMAFQQYNILGGSVWVGINNFADVLYDPRFWHSLKNALYFCALWMLMGFLPPMFLAVMLQEIPLGKILFRVLFYLPHLISGIVIFFMWRGIYDPLPDGILNKIIGFVGIPPQKWLQDPDLALFCVVFPPAWAHLGAGCIIYLAALKGIPDDLYEAADMDGASFFNKLRYIVFPYLKPLIVINAVGATIYGFKSADAVLAMTGGGPKDATQVIGYEIWQRSFLYLQFGQGTAMAWILGVLLLAFTAYQLRILNKVEFRTTGK